MDVITGSGYIPVLTLPECAIGEHVDYCEWKLDRCSNCGSSLFRNYTEKNGDEYETHQICAVCNCRLGSFVNKKYKLVIEPRHNGTVKLLINECIISTWYITDYVINDNYINFYDENRVLIGDVCLDNVKLFVESEDTKDIEEV